MARARSLSRKVLPKGRFKIPLVKTIAEGMEGGSDLLSKIFRVTDERESEPARISESLS